MQACSNINQFAVNPAGNGSLGKTGANRGGQVGNGCPFGQSPGRTVRKRYMYVGHMVSPKPDKPEPKKLVSRNDATAQR